MRILFVFARDHYLRNYGQSGALRDVQSEHECFTIVSGHCQRLDLARALPGFAGTFAVDEAVEAAHFDLYNALTWHHRRKSRTFRFRFSRLYRTHPYDTPMNVARNLPGIYKAARSILIGNRVVGPVVLPRIMRNLPVSPELERRVREVSPDMVIAPCSAYEPISVDVARLGHELGLRTLMLVDNWDNLSSKSIYWSIPDYLGVWGQQSRDHAERIHGIPPDRVFLLGTPRFESYYHVVKEAVRPPYSFPYVLFCGSALPFDELSALRRLDREIDEHPEVYGAIKVVYRPHPYRVTRRGPDRFEPREFRHVVLDDQLRDAYYARNTNFQPDLDYYPALLAGATLVVCPLTTMLIESIICRTPVLAITYDDGVHYSSPHNAYKYYLHFEGIEKIEGLQLNREADRLGADMRRMMTSLPVLSRETVDSTLEYFLHKDERPYARRLADAVRAIAPTR